MIGAERFLRVVIGAVAGVLILQLTVFWDEPAIAAAIASAVIAVAAIGVNVVRRARDNEQRRATARARLGGTAWLARRTVESFVRERTTKANVVDWANYCCSRATEAQAHFIEVSQLAIAAGDAETGAKALAAFIGAFDRLNELSLLNPTTTPAPRSNELAADAEEFLRKAATTLESFAPRRTDEPLLPERGFASSLPQRR